MDELCSHIDYLWEYPFLYTGHPCIHGHDIGFSCIYHGTGTTGLSDILDEALILD